MKKICNFLCKFSVCVMYVALFASLNIVAMEKNLSNSGVNYVKVSNVSNLKNKLVYVSPEESERMMSGDEEQIVLPDSKMQVLCKKSTHSLLHLYGKVGKFFIKNSGCIVKSLIAFGLSASACVIYQYYCDGGVK